MVLIKISSGIVNALIFVLIDIISLWAVHRGLLAVQGYMLYRYVQRGRTVKLRRSRIPIVSGELLVNQTRFPHVLVIANVLFITLAFIATFGVNGETLPRAKPTALGYVSRISADSRHNYRKRERLRPRIFLRCRRSNRTTLIYWPGAFNVSRNARLKDLYAFRDAKKVARMVNSSTLQCQHDAGDSKVTKPMLIVTNCTPAASGCSAAVEPRKAKVKFYANGTKPGWQNERVGTAALGLIALYRTLRESSDESVAKAGDRAVCLETSPRGSDLPRGQGRLNCMLFHWDKAKLMARISFGRIWIPTEEFYKEIDISSLKLEVTTATATVNWNVKELGEKFFSDGMRDLGVSSYSLADVMDNIVSRAVTAQMLRPSDRVYEEVERNVTSINTYSFAILSLIFVCAVLLVGVKEILLCTIGRNAAEMENALGANKYDTLSRMLRREQERYTQQLESGRSAEMSMLTNDGERRIGPSFDGRILGSEMEEERLPDDDFYATGNVFP